MNPIISIVIPAFNEERTIEDVLSRTYKTLDSIQSPYEIIVVDDGSTDKTKELTYRHKVTLLTNEENKGKGYALRRGLQSAQGDIIVTMDADGSHNPEDIKRLMKPILNGTDVVLGSRFMNGQGKNSTKKLHILGNNMINLLIRIITQKCITDSQTGFRAYKKRLIEEIEVTSEGYEVETELTVKALKNGNAVQEVPIFSEKRIYGYSRLNPLQDGFKIFKTILISSAT